MKLTPLLACLLAALPAAALADSHGGDHAHARSGFAPSRAYQSAPRQQQAPRYQQQAPRYQQQAPRYQQQAPRYQQQAPRYQQQAPRYQQQAPRYQQQAPRYQQQTWSAPRNTERNVQPLPRYNARPAQPRYAYNDYRGGYGGNSNSGWHSGAHVYYRGYDARPWGWNRGRVWVASPGFWAGGFWGGLSLGLSVNDYTNYAVQEDSPGYDLLSAYGLQQTDCDQPNLVQIYGPDGGEICAYPNDQVAPGAYQVDPSTLTLISQ